MAGKGIWEGIETRRNARGEIVSYRVRAFVGSGAAMVESSKTFPVGTPLLEMAQWRLDALARLDVLKQLPGTFNQAFPLFFKRVDPPLSKANADKKRQQFLWWAMQPIALDAPVLSVRDVVAQSGGSPKGKSTGRYGVIPPAPKMNVGKTIGQSRIAELDEERIRQILSTAFAPTDPSVDPTEFASTSNSYRGAIDMFFKTMFRGVRGAYNPLSGIGIRPGSPPRKVGQDMRVIAEMLKFTGSDRANGDGTTRAMYQRCIAVLAWCPICPIQLFNMKDDDFRDMPDASRQDMIDGAIAVMITQRVKGRRKKGAALPAPSLKPLTPRGVEALRAFRDAGGFAFLRTKVRSAHHLAVCLNRIVKTAFELAGAALLADGVQVVGLDAMTLYSLKHSLTATMQIASRGILDANGDIAIAPGVQKMLDHSSDGMTKIYALASVDPLLAMASKLTAEYLDQKMKTPLRPKPARRNMRLVG